MADDGHSIQALVRDPGDGCIDSWFLDDSPSEQENHPSNVQSSINMLRTNSFDTC